MHIKQVIVDGFKSYANRVVIDGWDPQFNAITGLNGSGKSNILDSICFVLGISQLKQVRANNLQELVYKQGQSRVTKATVTIIFSNSDKKRSPPGYEKYDEITVSRQVVIGGRNKYMINGRTVQLNRVKNLFHSVQLNVNNPHFLIMQGRITKVINMKPPEILSMIEEAAGTRMYENRKQLAMKTIQKKQIKVEEINKILKEDITPSLDKLRKERSVYMQWTANTQEIERLERFVIAATFMEQSETSTQTADKVQELQEEREALLEDNKNAVQEKADIEKKIREFTERKTKQMEGSFKAIEKGVTELSKDLVKHTSVWEHKKQEIESEKKSLKEAQAAAKKLDKSVKTKQAELDTATKIKGETEKKQKEVKEKVASLQGQQIGINMSDNKEEQGSLTNQLMEKQRLASQLEAELTTCQKNKDHLKTELKKQTKSMKPQEKEYKSLRKSFEAAKTKQTKLAKKLEGLGASPEETKGLSQQIYKLNQDFTKKKEAYDALAAEMSRYDFKYSIAGSFDRKKVKGLVAKLISIPDPGTTTAVEVSAGGKLFQVVVDTESTGKALLQRAKLQRRITIIPLNKIASRSLSPEIVKEAQRLVGSENADLALSMVGYDDKLQRAMEYVFGNTIICRDSECARKITFHPKIRTRTVTLDGDVYDPRGTLTGGGTSRKASVLSQLQKLSILEHDMRETEAKLRKAKEMMLKIKEKVDSIKEMRMQLGLAAHEMKLAETKLNECPYMQLKKTMDTVAESLNACTQEYDEKSKELKEVKQKCKGLEASIKDFEGQRKAKQKELEKELKKSKKTLSVMTTELKKTEQALDKLNMELQALNDEKKSSVEQMSKIAKNINLLEDEESKLSDAVARAKERYEEKNNLLEEKKKSLAACDQEIRNLGKAKNKIDKDVTNRELQVKRLVHKINRMESEAVEAAKMVKSLTKKHPWISQESHLFGKPNTDYDFKRTNFKTARARLSKLQKIQDDVSKRINKKAMGMFERAEQECQDLLRKREQIKKDKEKIHQVIDELDTKKNEALENTWKKVNKDFGSIFSACLPGTSARLTPQEGKSVLEGLEVKVAFNGVWKQSLSELSGGQRSLLALSLILALLRFKPAPMYILDEVDAALDLSHTQNIGQMLKKHFPQSQFVVVSLKEGMFNNANVIFRTKFVDGVSTVRKVKGVSRTFGKENVPTQTSRRGGKSKRSQIR